MPGKEAVAHGRFVNIQIEAIGNTLANEGDSGPFDSLNHIVFLAVGLCAKNFAMPALAI